MTNRSTPIFQAPVLQSSLLRAPTFPDADATRIARLLHIILIATVAVNLFYSISLLFTVPDPGLNLIVDGVLLGAQVASLLLMHRGRLRLASIILVSGIWVYCNFVIFVFGGSQSPAIVL